MDSSKVAPNIDEAEISLTRICRICMDGELPNTPLLSPCKCSGSIRYIHEECLKTWLVSHIEDLAESTCELCKASFLMEFKMKHKCYPRHSCSTGLNSCMFVPVLLAIVVILFVIVYLLADRYLASTSGSEEKGYTIALIITCAISGVILSILIVTSLREACCVSRLDDWKIYSQNFDEDDNEASEIRLEEWPGAGIMIVPECTKVGGVKVKTPILRPVLKMIRRRGNAVAYTSQCASPNFSLFRQTPVPMAARSDPMRPRSKSPHDLHGLGYKSIPDDSFNYV